MTTTRTIRLHWSSPYRELVESLDVIVEVEPYDRERAARALRMLDYPSDYATSGTQYVSHVPTFAYSPLADDILSESNYHVAARELEAYFDTFSGEGDGTAEDSSTSFEADVIDGRVRHWTYAYFDVLDVRPFYREGGRWYVTQAWREACELLEALEDYPVLDEMDFSDREYEATNALVASELDGTDGVWTQRALEALYSGHYDTHYEGFDLEGAYREAYEATFDAYVRDARRYLRLRVIGDGHYSMFGDGPSVVPSPPSLDQLDELLDPPSPRLLGEVFESRTEALEALRDELHAITTS